MVHPPKTANRSLVHGPVVPILALPEVVSAQARKSGEAVRPVDRLFADARVQRLGNDRVSPSAGWCSRRLRWERSWSRVHSLLLLVSLVLQPLEGASDPRHPVLHVDQSLSGEVAPPLVEETALSSE